MSDFYADYGGHWAEYEYGFDGYDPSGRNRSRRRTNFKKDPLHYHTLVRFKRIERETEKAYLLVMSDNHGKWVPKSACRSLDVDAGTVRVWERAWVTSIPVDLSPSDLDFNFDDASGGTDDLFPDLGI